MSNTTPADPVRPLAEDNRPLATRILEAVPEQPKSRFSGWARYGNECIDFVDRLRAALAAQPAQAEAGAVQKYRQKLEHFATFDDEGLLEPRDPYSWETLARVAIDYANAAFAAPVAAVPAVPGPIIKPSAWWLAEVSDPTRGATWSREPDAEDVAFVSKATGRQHAVYRILIDPVPIPSPAEGADTSKGQP